MNKTFKKAIAVILSVLMVVLSVPFTALAAPGDYTPNVKLAFGTFFDSGAPDYNDYSTSGAAASDFSFSSLSGVPVDFDYTTSEGAKVTGTLHIDKDKANTYNVASGSGYTTLDQDLQFGVGDYFTMSVILENVSEVFSFQMKLEHNDAIELAGLYSYKQGKKTIYGIGSESEKPANANWVKGGTDFLTDFSTSQKGLHGELFAAEPNLTKIQTVNGKQIINYTIAAPGKAITTTTGANTFYNPETGAPDYTYENCAIVATYAFKIVKDEPISFNIDDATAVKSCAYIANVKDGNQPHQATTYAKNFYNPDTTQYDYPTEWEGSRKMTFMGFNEFNEAPKPSTHTITFTPYGGEPTTQTVNDGAMPKIPANTATTKPVASDSTHHSITSYKWTPDVVAATADATYTEEAVVTNPECKFEVTDHKDATVKEEGYDVYTCTDKCGNTYTKPIDKLPCDHADTKVVNATKPTINNAGYTGDTVCNVCGKTIAKGTVIAQLNGNDYRDALKAAQSKNAKDYTEASYAKVTAALKDYAEDVVATYTDPADVAKATKALEDAVTQLDPGVVVTVASTKLGSTTLNDADATNGANARLAVGDKVVLTAKANNETGEFVGWKVGNKIVSDEATFVTYAAADITYEPVFAEKVDTSFTVVFVDPYGNVIDTQTVDSAAKIEVPTAPALPGYTFTGWSMTEEAISKLTDGATIYAQYKKDNVAKYTVTAPEGATLTVDGVETASPATVAYDAKVSVHKDGAQAWKLADGTVVGYGDTYTFFCGSNIELTAEMTAVEKKTTIVIVDAKQMKDSHKVIFNATRTVIPGETVVQQGFVYGKNLADSELTLENVGNKGAAANAGNVKVIYNKNSAEQIALSYGLTSQNGKISAVAFVITKNNLTGKLTPVYSNVMPFTYGA